MKRSVILAAVVLLLSAVSCQTHDPVRDMLLQLTSDLTPPESVAYDAPNSTATILSVYWDAATPMSFGAVEFCVEAATDEFFFSGEGGSLISCTVPVSSSPNDAVMLTGVTEGQAYYVRVAAVYPGPSKSDWTYLRDADGKLVAVIPGSEGGGGQQASQTITGKVLDETGKPFAGVVMSDGYSCAVTDAQGSYSLEKYRYASYIQCSVPADAEISTGGTYKLPDCHYKRITSATTEYNFTFRRQEPEKRFRIFALGDPQVHNTSQIERYRQTARADIRQYVVNSEKIPTYAVTLGDNVGDEWSLFPDLAAVLGDMSIPVFATIGNHDHEFPSESESASRRKYEAVFGPSNFSFNRGDVHIVVFDNVLHGATSSGDYDEGYESWQLNWLKKDLSYVPVTSSILFSCHIPLTDATIIKLLAGFKSATVICGHTHKIENIYDKTVSGKTVSICAAGSTGAPWKGLILSDGCQRGYKVFEYDGATVSREYYKSIQYPDTFQMRMFRTTDFPSFTTPGGYIYAYPYFGDNYIAVNVFNHRSGWKLSLKENGVVTSTNPKQAASFDVWAKMFLYNYYNRDNDVGKTRHILFFELKDPSAKVSVEATDNLGYTYSCDTFTTQDDIPDYDK